MKWSAIMAGGDVPFGCPRLGDRPLGRDGDEGIHLRIDSLDSIQAGAHDLYRGKLASLEQRRELGNRLEENFRSSHRQDSQGSFVQDSLGRLDGVVDFKVTERPQLREAVFEDRLYDPQPIVAQPGSVNRGHVAKSIQSDGGLRPISRRAIPTGERQRL